MAMFRRPHSIYQGFISCSQLHPFDQLPGEEPQIFSAVTGSGGRGAKGLESQITGTIRGH